MEACAILLDRLITPCQEVLKREPPIGQTSDHNMYLVLNALAMTVATIVTGCSDERVEPFFDQLLEYNKNLVNEARKRHRLH